MGPAAEKGWERSVTRFWVWREVEGREGLILCLPRSFPAPFQKDRGWEKSEQVEERFQKCSGYATKLLETVLDSVKKGRRERSPAHFRFWGGGKRKRLFEDWLGLSQIVWTPAPGLPDPTYPTQVFLAWNPSLRVGVVTEKAYRADALKRGFCLLVLRSEEDGKYPDLVRVGRWVWELAQWAYFANQTSQYCPWARDDLSLLISDWGEGKIDWQELVGKTFVLINLARNHAKLRRIGGRKGKVMAK